MGPIAIRLHFLRRAEAIKMSSYKQNQPKEQEMAMIADFMVTNLKEMLFNMAKDELTIQMGFNDDVKKLQLTLEDLQSYLQDAETKRIGDDSTNRWLNQIKDVMYDIDDLLDEYYALELSSSDDDKSSSSSPTHDRPFKKVCYSILQYPFKKPAAKHSIGVQIAELNKKLLEIMSQIPRLQLMRTYPTIDLNQAASDQLAAHMTHSAVVRTDVVGGKIHNDASCLVEMLTKQDDRDNPLVYAIVGMGGIGKTTLAKLIFDDEMIKNCFGLKVWVCVSQNYDEIATLRSICRSAGGGDERCHDLNLLCEKVKDSLQGKRLLMVLDDMWETESVWKGVLRSLLKSGAAKGSRVLITTRNKDVADQMMAVHSHQVQPLPLEDGWSLLCKSAFPAWLQQEAKDDVWNLRDIGMELVKKCDGLPLAINIIGGMLSAESRTRDAWGLVLRSSAWEVNGLPKEIHKALYISYQYLPMNIKQCFLYCSILPKDNFVFVFDAKVLWIQEGLIKDNMNIALDDVAERFLRILGQRNLLTLHQNYINSRSFTMHDLVYSLSQFLIQNESLVATGEKILNYKFSRTMKLRRLSYISGGDKIMNILPKSLEQQVSLRSLLIFDKSICKIDNDIFNHLHRLRILWLKNTNVSNLPDSLGSLKQLRYLNLANTPIKELPKTIQNLKNLRYLNVSMCVNLDNLPSCIMKLHRLCYLLIEESALNHLPLGLGRLNKLQVLDFIMPPEDVAPESSTIKELARLMELRNLGLYKLERMLDRSEAKSVALKDKIYLRGLELCCSESDSIQVSMNCTQAKEVNNKIEEIFEDLCPPPQLDYLLIRNYFGSKLPSWLGHARFNFLVYLNIFGCSNCKQLNGLGLLPSLEKLTVDDASSIKSIGPAFYRGNDKSDIEKGALEPASQKSAFFPRIKILIFMGMDSWEEWSSLGKDIPVMSYLEKLFIYDCPILKSFPEKLLHHASASLKHIRISDAEKLLLKVVHNLPHLEILHIKNIPHLETISGLPALQALRIWDCPGIKSVELKHHLQDIYWEDFKTDSLPGWFSTDGYGDDNRLKATYLGISCKEELVKKICVNEENEVNEMSKIQHFDRISVRDKDGRLRLSYTKNPSSFTVHPVPIEAPEIIVNKKRIKKMLITDFS